MNAPYGSREVGCVRGALYQMHISQVIEFPGVDKVRYQRTLQVQTGRVRPRRTVSNEYFAGREFPGADKVRYERTLRVYGGVCPRRTVSNAYFAGHRISRRV